MLHWHYPLVIRCSGKFHTVKTNLQMGEIQGLLTEARFLLQLEAVAEQKKIWTGEPSTQIPVGPLTL